MKKHLITFCCVLLSTIATGQTISSHKNAVIHHQARIATTNPSLLENHQNALIDIQYFDGLGRPEQKLDYRRSPQEKDVVLEQIQFDQYGRSILNFLPTPTSENTGSHKTNVAAAAQGFYADAFPFSETTGFDNSPLNRPSESFGPGNAWRSTSGSPATKSNRTGYSHNLTNEVRLYTINANGDISLSGFYPEKALYKVSQTDEQGHRSISFKDIAGQTIETWQEQQTDIYAKTHYLYDGADRILAVIQPEGLALNAPLPSNGSSWEQYVFFYRYDNKGLLYSKKIPGAEEEYYVYDKWNRLVASQNGYQRSLQKWSFFKYDQHDRQIISGQYSNAQNRATLNVSVLSFESGKTRAYESRNTSSPVFYSLNQTFPSTVSVADIRQVSFYDDYSSWLPTGMAFDAGAAFHAQHANAKGLVTGSKTKNGFNGSWINAVQYYDTKGRAIQSFQQNTYGHIERTDLEYLFAGEISKERMLCKDANANPFTKLKTYTYDHAGRKISYHLTLGNTQYPSDINQQIGHYEYDELGRQIKKTLLPNGNFMYGGTKDYIIRPTIDATVSQANTEDIAKKAVTLEPVNEIKAIEFTSYLAAIDPNASDGVPIVGLQQMNYSYHLRGALQGINLDNAGNPTPEATEGDLFAYKLDYENEGMFDGNIGKQIWKNDGSTSSARSYTFSYDKAKRLKTATYMGVGAENFTLPNINYDKNGNILNLRRNGALTPTTFGMMDDLTYTYAGNKLNAVSDAINGDHEVDLVPRSGGAYTYWPNGALKSDANEGITLISYDGFLNQPTELQLTGGPGASARWIKYYYDGFGMLLKTEYANGETWTYTTTAVYKNDTLYQINDDEGRILLDAATNHFSYEFNYQDHLGNTRVSFKADGSNLEKVAETAFDPWGVRLVGVGSQNGIQNRWELQGKEKESTFGLRRLSFGARTYNATIGRFDGVDAMADAAPNWSPYRYNFNNPLSFIDPDGNLEFSNGYQTFTEEDAGFENFATSWATDMYDSQKDGPGDGEKNKKESAAKVAGAAILAGISADLAIPDPTDALPQKWAAEAVGAVVASALLYGSDAIDYLKRNFDPGAFYYVTYTKTNKEGMVYVGRTSGFGDPASIVKKRDASHHIKNYGPAILSSAAQSAVPLGFASRINDPAYWTIRGSEQLQIEAYRRIGISSNIRNGIGSSNRELEKFIEWGSKLF